MRLSLVMTLALTGLGVLNSTAQTIPAYVPANGLAGWWPFTNNANDLSGLGHNGSVAGAALTTDRFSNSNSAYDFSSGYISCSPTGIPVNGVMSISAWINPSSDYNLGEYICLGTTGNTSWGAVGGNNKFTVNYGRNCGSTGSSLQTIPLSYNQWHHVVYVSSGLAGTSDIYYDGVLIGTSTNANAGGSCSTANLFFGKDVYFNTLYPGKLDDIGIWNRALTACEVSDLYHSAFTNCGGVGISEHSNLSLYSVSPNPSNGLYRLQTDAALTGAPYTIYDYTGKTILSGTVTGEQSLIRLEDQAAGIYLLSIGGNKQNSIKLVKE